MIHPALLSILLGYVCYCSKFFLLPARTLRLGSPSWVSAMLLLFLSFRPFSLYDILIRVYMFRCASVGNGLQDKCNPFILVGYNLPWGLPSSPAASGLQVYVESNNVMPCHAMPSCATVSFVMLCPVMICHAAMSCYLMLPHAISCYLMLWG